MVKSRLPSNELLTLDAYSLRERLEGENFTSVELVTSCLLQTGHHDGKGTKLHTIVSTAPHELLLKRARQFDNERKFSHIRSPLHSIPVLIKVRYSSHSKAFFHVSKIVCQQMHDVGSIQQLEPLL